MAMVNDITIRLGKDIHFIQKARVENCLAHCKYRTVDALDCHFRSVIIGRTGQCESFEEGEPRGGGAK